jgi:hypothetical protein
MGEFPGSKDKFVDESRVWVNQNDHKAIVCHGTGGNPAQTADQLGDFFETTPDRTSVHYGIDRAGNIDQYVLEKDGAGGNGILDPGYDPFWNQYADNPNWHSLSFETENDSTNSLPLTDPQKQAMFKLVAYWVKKYDIPLSNIKGHFSLEPVNRVSCPGPNFPWKELFDYLTNGGTQPMATTPTGWTDDGTTLKSPDGTPVQLGFRDRILNSNWDPANIPLEPEQHLAIVEQSNPSLGAGQAQTFRMDRLEYTEKMGVFAGWLGQELLWYQKQYTALQAQIADLQKQVASLQTSALAQENATLKAKINAASKDLS